jgi:DNA processing protein
MEEILFEVAIGMIPGIGSHHTRQLVSYCGSPRNVFTLSRGKLKKIPGIGDVLAEAIIAQKDVLKKAEKEVLAAERSGTQILFYTNQKYPERLKQIPDAPALLYYKGSSDLNHSKIIGIVGTRNATNYGKEVVEKIVSELTIHQPLIISGLAYGIDYIAHNASLKNNLETIGVMASGIDIVYPSVHRELARKMKEKGGLITEYPFGTKPDGPHFPSRNRIIAGLCDAVIVAEAAEKGGALITAEIANGYNREVFAVPGNISNAYSVGCNNLIRSHKAHILTSVKDLEYILNWDLNQQALAKKEKKDIDLSGLNEEEKKIVFLIKESEEILIDDLSWKSQIPINKLASIILNLEFQGMVKTLPGKKFRLNLN